MDARTVAAYDELLARIPDMRRIDALSCNPEPELIDVLEMGLQRMRDTYARRLEPEALTERAEASSPSTPRLQDTKMKNRPAPSAPWRDQGAEISSPRAVCLRDTKMKKRPEPAAAAAAPFCSLDDGPRENFPSPAADNVRRSSPRISWNEDVEAVCIIPAHQQPEVNYLPRLSPILISLER